MSTESDDERYARWQRDEERRSAIHRRRMRWWKHAREYLSMKRMVSGDLLRPRSADTATQLPDHPPWSPLGNVSNWYPSRRWNRQG